MTTLSIAFEYDAEDDVTRSISSERFFAAWINQFGMVEYTCVPEDAPEFADLLGLIERDAD